MRKAFVSSLLDAAKKDDSILLLTGDLGYGVLDNFRNELPNQFINFGINEQSMMSAAAGFAKVGYKPFVYSIGNFPTFRCMEQIRNDVCFMDLNVCVVSVGVGFSYGISGYSHYLIEDIGGISSLPNIEIYSPADHVETQFCVERLLLKEGPKYLRIGKGGEGEIDSKYIGGPSGVTIAKGIDPICIISTGQILQEVIIAERILAKNKIFPTIINVSEFSSVSKIDAAVLLEKKIFTVEEHLLRAGFGSLIKEFHCNLADSIHSIGVSRLNTRVVGNQSYLREYYELDGSAIANTVARVLN